MEKKYSYVGSLVLSSIFLSGSAAAAEIVTFSPGPDFTTRVHTSSGDYIVDMSPSGQTVWVGTEAEFIDRKARAIMSKDGFIEMDAAGQPANEHHFVNSKLPAAQLGSTRIAEIMPSIDLAEQKYSPEAHAPPHRPGFHYIAISWTASADAGARATLLDTKVDKSFKPFHCWDSSTCLWQLPDGELGVPITILFTAPGQRPAATVIRSIAYEQYEADLPFYRSVPEAAKAAGDKLSKLHAFDSNVPLTVPPR